MLKKLFALVACLMLATAVHAQQVLFLSPDEQNMAVGHAPDVTLTNNAYNAFNANAGVIALGGMRDGRNALSSATPDVTLFDGVQLVILTTTYAAINPAWYPVLQNLMLTRPDLTFVMFPDGCCNVPSSLNPIVDIIKLGTGWSLSTPISGNWITSPLNTSSLYQGSFAAAGLNPLNGGYFSYVSGVPADNALYLAPGAPNPAPGTVTNAYGFFVPQQGFNGGNGSCIFLVADVSPFIDAFAAQFNSIATAFVNAATDPAGACKQPTRAPDLLVAWSGPTTGQSGLPLSFTLTVTNGGASGSSDGTLTVPMPVGMQLNPASLPANCTAIGTTSFSCVLAALAPAASTAIVFSATPTQAGGLTMNAAITGVTNETNLANNTSPWVLAISAPDLGVTWSGASTGPLGITMGFTLTIANDGTVPNTNGTLTVPMPAGMQLVPGSLPANCTATGTTAFTCNLSVLAPGASTGIAFSAIPLQEGEFAMTATISDVMGEVNLANNVSPWLVQIGTAKAVPSLGALALAVLGALLAALGMRRRA